MPPLNIPKSFMYESTDIPEGMKLSQYHQAEREAKHAKTYHPIATKLKSMRRSTHKGIDQK